MSERREINELLNIPREQLSEVEFILREPELETLPGTDIIERIRATPFDRIAQLTTFLRDSRVDPRADGWSDHYSQKTGNGWRDSWKDQKGGAIPLDRIPSFEPRSPGPSFDDR